MRKSILILAITMSLGGIGCSGDDGDSLPSFPTGNWQLSEITFEQNALSATLLSGRLLPFKLTFASDNTLTAEGNGASQSYTWSHETGTSTITISGGGSDRVVTLDGTAAFNYEAFSSDNMSSTTGDNRQIAELAASTFIQNRVKYDPTGPLKVYFKFKQI